MICNEPPSPLAAWKPRWWGWRFCNDNDNVRDDSYDWDFAMITIMFAMILMIAISMLGSKMPKNLHRSLPPPLQVLMEACKPLPYLPLSGDIASLLCFIHFLPLQPPPTLLKMITLLVMTQWHRWCNRVNSKQLILNLLSGFEFNPHPSPPLILMIWSSRGTIQELIKFCSGAFPDYNSRHW